LESLPVLGYAELPLKVCVYGVVVVCDTGSTVVCPTSEHAAGCFFWWEAFGHRLRRGSVAPDHLLELIDLDSSSFSNLDVLHSAADASGNDELDLDRILGTLNV
jgi:hypothetical protein